MKFPLLYSCDVHILLDSQRNGVYEELVHAVAFYKIFPTCLDPPSDSTSLFEHNEPPKFLQIVMKFTNPKLLRCMIG